MQCLIKHTKWHYIFSSKEWVDTMNCRTTHILINLLSHLYTFCHTFCHTLLYFLPHDNEIFVTHFAMWTATRQYAFCHTFIHFCQTILNFLEKTFCHLDCHTSICILPYIYTFLPNMNELFCHTFWHVDCHTPIRIFEYI